MCLFIMITPSIIVTKIAHFLFFFLLMTAKICHNLGKTFKCIWKNFWSFFRKRYGSLSSEIPLARCQPLKTQRFNIFCWLNIFFDISTLNISRTVTPKPITIPFSERIQYDFLGPRKYEVWTSECNLF